MKKKENLAPIIPCHLGFFDLESKSYISIGRIIERQFWVSKICHTVELGGSLHSVDIQMNQPPVHHVAVGFN